MVSVFKTVEIGLPKIGNPVGIRDTSCLGRTVAGQKFTEHPKLTRFHRTRHEKSPDMDIRNKISLNNFFQIKFPPNKPLTQKSHRTHPVPTKLSPYNCYSQEYFTVQIFGHKVYIRRNSLYKVLTHKKLGAKMHMKLQWILLFYC